MSGGGWCEGKNKRMGPMNARGNETLGSGRLEKRKITGVTTASIKNGEGIGVRSHDA